MDLISLLGDKIVKNDGKEVKTLELPSKSGSVIGLYFSAHWCPPCRQFTPTLASVYKEVKEAGHDFEVVFVSSDKSEDEFKSYHGEMPWMAIPYKNEDAKDACSAKFNITGFPTLVLLDGEKRETISTDGRSAVEKYGATGFPFTETKLDECKKEKEAQRANALTELGPMSFIGPLTTINNPKAELNFEEATSSCEALAIAFVSGSSDQGSSVVIPKLIAAQNSLGKNKLGVIFILLEDMEAFDEDLKSKMNDTPIVTSGQMAKEVVKRFEVIFQDIQSPQVIVLSPNVLTQNSRKSFTLYAENAARDIYFTGEEGFPWSEEALAALQAKQLAAREEIKSRQKNLEFLSTGDQSHVVDKNGGAIPLTELQSKDVVGLYFSAHWCGPCKGFTPKLAKLYNQCKEQNKSFEVVFISSDRNEDEFLEYFGEMPWLALSFKERKLKSALSDNFDVEGIPTLVLLTGKGEIITEDGDDVVRFGEDYFPWDEASMQKANEEAKEKARRVKQEAIEAEQNVIREQEEAGKIVLRRHIGEPQDVIISVDHEVEFKDFSTVVASLGVIPEGKKALYEVTFKKKSGSAVSQIGWAMDGFVASDEYEGDGVGDCDFSYGFDGQRGNKWHSGPSKWGKHFEPEDNRVLGVAVDLENGKLLYGLDGDWSDPMGLAFDGIEKNVKLFPAITASNIKLALNFGDNEFKYGHPDSSFVGLKQALSPKQ